ncbi:hypothetical protein C8J57DRAFT_1237797 [Mycena rebaudengoi]|nr:hypothetical protein C8J57DRAFT_1237797 [Mycena rebaudengoi]
MENALRSYARNGTAYTQLCITLAHQISTGSCRELPSVERRGMVSAARVERSASSGALIGGVFRYIAAAGTDDAACDRISCAIRQREGGTEEMRLLAFWGQNESIINVLRIGKAKRTGFDGGG